MKTLRKVLICGLGAIGVIYADKLSKLDPEMLYVLADEERIRKYKKEPVVYNGKELEFNYVLPSETSFKADLIIIAVKNNGLHQAIENIENFITKDTIIMSFMNGISSEEQIAAKYGRKNILYSFFVGHTSSRIGRNVTFDGQGEIVFGEKENNNLSDRVVAVKNLFESAKIRYSIPEDMEYAMWKKFLVNIGTNQASAVLGGEYKLFQNSKTSMNIALSLMKEGQAVAKAMGIKNTEIMLEESAAIIYSMLPETKSSMLQDVEAKRKTEVEIFSGKVTELGKMHGIETPNNEMFFKLISALDEKSRLI